MGIFKRRSPAGPTAPDAAPLSWEERCRSLFEHATAGLATCTVVLDEHGAAADYVFDRVNRAFEELTGLAASEVLGRRVTQVLPGAAEDGLVADLARVAVTGEPAHLRRYSSGLERYLDLEAFPWGPGRFAVYFLDVTGQVRSDLARARLARAIEQLGEVVVITDPEGVIEYVNPAFERVTGYSRAEALGSTPRLLKSGRQHDAFYADLWEKITRGETWSGQLVNRRKDGTFYRQEASISPVRDAGGRIVNYVNVARDVTRLIELEEQLRQSQKLEAVGSLAGGLAHDLSNILSIVTANADLLVQGLRDGDEAMLASATDIHAAAVRATRMVKQLLGFSRKAALERRPILLPSVVAELSSMMSRLIPETVEVRIAAATRVPPVLADPLAVEQMVVNLVMNARDAMPAGGVLEIDLEARERSSADLEGYPGASPGLYACISVTDDGVGMDEATRTHLFDPFFTTKAPGKGTGLGLSVTYGLMQQHEGFVEVESSPGLGSRVSLCFPAIAGSVVERTSERRSSLPRGRGQTLLVVEDEEPLRRTARRVLERHGYRVLTAENGDEALDLVRLHADRLSLVLTDVVMPGRGGPGLLAALNEAGYTIPVLFTSGYAEAESAGSHPLPPDAAFLPKPWSVESLLRMIHDMLEPGEPASGRLPGSL